MKFWKLYREKGSNKMEKGVLCQNGSQWAEDIKNHLTGQGILGVCALMELGYKMVCGRP